MRFDGTNHLLVWNDTRNGSFDVFGARVSTAGVASPEFAVAAGGGAQVNPSVAFDGTNYLVVFQDDQLGDFDIRGARVGTSGTGPFTSFPIYTAAGFQAVPSVAFSGVNYLVAWQDNQLGSFDIRGARVSKAGGVLDPTGRLLSMEVGNDQSRASVAFDGTNYFVAWQDNRNGSFDIFGTRVTRNAVVLDTAGIPIFAGAGDQTAPTVAFGGGQYLVAWESFTGAPVDIVGRRVSPAGVVTATDIPISVGAGDQLSPRATFGGGNFFVVWADSRSGAQFDIFGRRVSTAGALLAEVQITNDPADQFIPAVDTGGTNYLVVWEDSRQGALSAPDVFGARVSTAGALLDPAGIILSAGGGIETAPAVAFDGTNRLVVWQDDRGGNYDIFGARVNTSGVVLGEIAIEQTSSSQTSPALAFATGRFLVAWEDNAAGQTDIRGQGVTTAGALTGASSFVIANGSTNERLPSLAGDNVGNFLVAYERLVPAFGRVRARARIAAP